MMSDFGDLQFYDLFYDFNFKTNNRIKEIKMDKEILYGSIDDFVTHDWHLKGQVRVWVSR